MAHTNRHSQSYLAQLSHNKEALYQEGFEPLLRYIDANSPLHARLGFSVTLKQDPLRLGQSPMLHFHASPFSDVSQLADSGFYKLKNVYWGMFGSNGPLPLHFTEFAIERDYRHNDKTLTEFCDIFHHRFISLFYRSWAEAQPVVSYDRSENDVFSKRIASFSGYLSSSLVSKDIVNERLSNGHLHVNKPSHAEPSQQHQQNLNDQKRFLAGLLSIKNRSAGALEQILSEYLQQEVNIQAFEGEWFELPEDAKSSLGKRNASLGMDCVLGEYTFQRGFNYSILVGPLAYNDYLYLVNNKHHFKNMQKLAVHHAGLEYSFTIKLLLHQEQRPGAVLGIKASSALGQNTWLTSVNQTINKQQNSEQEQPKVAYQYAC